MLPPEVVWRKKHGFEIPVDSWLRGPLRDMFESTVLAPGARVGDLVNQVEAGRLYRSHCTRTGRHGDVLWSLLMLARWSERWLADSVIGDR
jgi:asparagine synthase (glutamine-hydrolysing)